MTGKPTRNRGFGRGPIRGESDTQQGILWRATVGGRPETRPHGSHLPRGIGAPRGLSDGKRVSAAELLRIAHRMSEGFEIRYLVYRELRQRGYVVKLGQPPLDFRVFPRGGSPNKTRASGGRGDLGTLDLRPREAPGEPGQDERRQEETAPGGHRRGERRHILRGQASDSEGKLGAPTSAHPPKAS